MRRLALLLVVITASASGLPANAIAQGPGQWNPPSSEMPQMPTMASLQADWRAEMGSWLRGVDAAAGVEVATLRATGSPRRGSDRAQLLRLMNGPVPAVVWTDRNGDSRADMVEIYRGGTVSVQVIDVDYNGRANVIRRYDSAGTLLREDRP